jgi:hypothetical protein
MLGHMRSGVGRQPTPRRKRYRDGLNVFNFRQQKPQRNINSDTYADFARAATRSMRVLAGTFHPALVGNKAPSAGA